MISFPYYRFCTLPGLAVFQREKCTKTKDARAFSWFARHVHSTHNSLVPSSTCPNFLGAVFRNVLQTTLYTVVLQNVRQTRFPKIHRWRGVSPRGTWYVSTQQAAAGSWNLGSCALNTGRIITLLSPDTTLELTLLAQDPNPTTIVAHSFTPTRKTHITSPCAMPLPCHSP